MIMHGPMSQGYVHNSLKLKMTQFFDGLHTYKTCHPLSMFGMLWIDVYDSVFQFLPISSNFAQPLKRSGTTFHNPQPDQLHAKGDRCPFRHCDAAKGSEVVCSLWQESRCFRQVCKFRHMEIKKNRKEMACYWENQPAGCQKPHCAFHHEKPHFIDGQYVPPNKSFALKEEEEPHEDPLPPVSAPIPVNPQLRGVIKAETQENVPSPTHPPVVINPADDDEDEDDQFSEGEDSRYGSDGSRVVSPRKMAVASNSDDSLNFGVRTLEEIRLRKALKASMRIAGYPVPGQGSDQRNNGMSSEKENMKSFIRPSLFTAKDEVPAEGDIPMNRRLAERLGRNMEEDEMDLPPRKAVKPVRDRLGLPVEPIAASESAAITTTQKTSEVTKKEKPAEPAAVATEATPANGSSVNVKTFEEIMHEKRLRRQRLQEEQASSTSHSEQASSTSHSEQASSTSHSEQASSTSHSEGFAKAESTQKQAGGPAPQREKRVWVSPSAASSHPTITLEAPAQAPKAPSPLLCATLSPQQGTPLRQAEPDSPSLSPRSFSTAPGKRERGSPGGSSPPKQAALASATSPRTSVEEAPVEKAGQATEAKVRPKLNVRPSVIKPAAQVKPGQKRRAAERSAVAAVKPLNCTSTAQDEPPQELPCKLREVSFPSSRIQAQISPMVPRSPPTIPGLGRSSSPLREEFQVVPVKQHSPAIPTAAPDTYIVPQSSLVKTPTQPKTRRSTVSSSAMDEFDELMIEFTDDRLEDDLELDPGKGEDDYLLELSEMIDS
ncbi:zinc finger CCCH domain-containing protein 11A isoform X4 [Salmo salar]|uniref:Zinc finger CCCH domain-containing protein 11A isoform X4 n=1 Tax=Salmo salar TaxID=8030 RepID=A0A1S3P6U2_SALSA|nr:zinc finger CCCH domain-containing protein 11A-like isoform X4 [Salmo salar]